MGNEKILIIGGPDVNARIDLINLLKTEYEFVCFGSSKNIKKEFDKFGIEYRAYSLNLNFNPLLDVISLISLVRLIKIISPTILHTFDTKPSILGRMAAKICNTPIIIGTLPGLGSLYSSDGIIVQSLRFIYEKLVKYICNFSKMTIFQNYDDQNQLIEKDIVNKYNSTVILGSGIDTKELSPSKTQVEEIDKLRNELKLNPHHMVVTLITRVIKSKGVKEFSEAAKSIKTKNNNLFFLLVGEYNNKDFNSFSMDEFDKICKDVTWLGYRKDIKNVIALSDIIVLPTYYREGIPRVLLESASMKKPLIATNTPGCKEILVNGENGYLINPRDARKLKNAILKLINNPSLRKSMGEESRKLVVSKFDISIIAEQHKKLYQDLLNNRNTKI